MVSVKPSVSERYSEFAVCHMGLRSFDCVEVEERAQQREARVCWAGHMYVVLYLKRSEFFLFFFLFFFYFINSLVLV